jgi:serine/threonine protein kinase
VAGGNVAEIQANDVLVGRYKIEKHLRSGDLTELWYARDMILRRNLAIRIVQTKMLDNSQYLVRFSQESQILAQMEHPHIAPIYDYGVHEERPFQVQRFIGTENLLQWYEKQPKPIPTVSLLHIIQQLASALDFIHQRGIVHRAFRATTVIIDEETQPYVINFILAKDMKAHSDAPDSSRRYAVLSPEEKEGASADAASDIYAFGLLVYSLFTGEGRPKIQYNQVVSRVRDTRPDLPLGLDLVVHRLLHSDKEQRYESAVQAANELTAAFYSKQTSIEGRIFISYATKDSHYVHRLAKELRRLNIDIWIDQDIEKGSDWGMSIENALKETDIMLLILSEASSVSEYVTHEWSYFMGSGKPVYPFVLQSSPAKEIHPRLNRVQHIMGTNELFNDVLRIIDVLAGGNPSRIEG